MRTAIVHDWLVTLAGAERVLEAIYEIYPSPIFTLVADRKALKDSIFRDARIHTSFIQRFPKAKEKYRNYLPLFPLAIEQFDLSDYDLIISSSYAVAKGVITNSNQVHICYCHTPIRYAWDMYHLYLRQSGLDKKIIKGLIAKIILHYMRLWDYATSNRVDYFLANSKYTARRIKRVYGRDATVIYPPVEVDRFEVNTKKEDFYLTVSRIVPYKRVDIIIDAFSQIKDRRLIVIGDGPDLKKIKGRANKNIEFLGRQPFDIVKDYMRRARALVFCAEEEFGIVPVEAQACGTPVIALGRGGVRETVIENKTGIFFYGQSPKDIIEAIKAFERKEDRFDPYEIRKNVEFFSKKRFKRELKEFIEKIYL
ncbi:MAG: glycosyltransferase family 4 protein [Deltaproteobacteria bacterium]|nr:glycosyltransferase family 4 protein [Deltaproteobacteria bacterium]